MRKCYRIFSYAVAPLLPLWLEMRRMRGKEDGKRIHERFGHASYKRPTGTLLWLHAASVGEANSVLYLISELLKHFSPLSILLTTGTVTSARLMQSRLPKNVIHQYVPVDTPAAAERFMRYWRPDVALWVESELWPNLIESADKWQCYMGIINGRMSQRSFYMWNKYPDMIRNMLGKFDIVFAQSNEDAARFSSLGAKNVSSPGNLKYDAPALACNEAELAALREQIGNRPLWLAASTHPGEESLIKKAHSLIAQTRRDLLTVIAPRHPHRGEAIASDLSKTHKVALRSRKEPILPQTEFYIADTMGELGLFYRICDKVFMGGSLVAHGGQNPLEPARLSCAILTGTHTHNFSAIYDDMIKQGAVLRVNNAEDLAAQIMALFSNGARASAMQSKAKEWVDSKSGACERLLDVLGPVFTYRKGAS